MDVLIASLVSWVCAWAYFRWRHGLEEQRLRGICQQVADRAYELLDHYDKPGFLVFCSDGLVAREAASGSEAAISVLHRRGIVFAEKEI